MATKKQQGENRDATEMVTIDGITDSMTPAAERIGCNSPQMFRRWTIRGFEPQEIADQYRSLPNGTEKRNLFSTVIVHESWSPDRFRAEVAALFDDCEKLHKVATPI